jgi:hypothetical protein
MKLYCLLFFSVTLVLPMTANFIPFNLKNTAIFDEICSVSYQFGLGFINNFLLWPHHGYTFSTVEFSAFYTPSPLSRIFEN